MTTSNTKNHGNQDVDMQHLVIAFANLTIGVSELS